MDTTTPSRDEVIRLSTYHAAVYGWYDTSEASQHAGNLRISVMDKSLFTPLPQGARYHFYVMINHCAFSVAHYPPDRYEVASENQTGPQLAEWRLRESVLDAALWYLTGEGSGYQIGAGLKAREAAIRDLLADGPEEDKDADLVKHPVIRDMPPDPTVSLAPGLGGGAGPQVLRQWSVQIGGMHNTCNVHFFGYDEDGPVLVPMNVEESD